MFVVGPPLTVNNVIDALGDLASHWRDIRWSLGIPNTVLDAIEADHPTSRDCFRASLRFYLYRCPFASWRDIIVTLDHMCGDSDYEDYRDDLKRVHANIKLYAEKLTGQSVHLCYFYPYA